MHIKAINAMQKTTKPNLNFWIFMYLCVIGIRSNLWINQTHRKSLEQVLQETDENLGNTNLRWFLF